MSLPRKGPPNPPDKAEGNGKWRIGGSGDYVRDPLQMGLMIVGVTAVLGGAGWWLDSVIGTFPILMALGAVLGLFGILYVTVKQLKASDQSSSRPPDKPA